MSCGNEHETITVERMIGSVRQSKIVHPCEVDSDYCMYGLDLGLGYHVNARLPTRYLTGVYINATFCSPENLYLKGCYRNDKSKIPRSLNISIITSLDRRNQPRLFPAFRLFEAFLQILEPLYDRLTLKSSLKETSYPLIAYYDSHPFQLYLLDTLTPNHDCRQQSLSYLNPLQMYTWTREVLQALISEFCEVSEHSLVVLVLSEILQYTQERIDRVGKQSPRFYHFQQIRQPTLSMFNKLTLLQANVIAPIKLSLLDVTVANLAVRLAGSPKYSELEISLPHRLYDMISRQIEFINRQML